MLGEVAGDGGVVVGRVGEHLGGELAPDLGADRAARSSPSTSWIVRGIHDRQHELVVLGRRAEHGRPADVDVLDGVLERHVGLGDGHLERIEVHRDQVDRADAVLGEGAAM